MSAPRCCGCWSAFVSGISGNRRTGSRVYRRAKYNEREYSIEFENLIEEEDFYAPAQHAVTPAERTFLSKGKFDDLLRHEQKVNQQQDDILRQQEENAKLEDEAFIQAKMEAAKVSKQSMKKQKAGVKHVPDMKTLDHMEFSKWLSEENIDITSPDFNIDDFDVFLDKMKANSMKQHKGDQKKEAQWEETMTQGLEATKIAGEALDALQPVELHAVESNSNTSVHTTAIVNSTINRPVILNPYEAASNISAALEKKSDPSTATDMTTQASNLTGNNEIPDFHKTENPENLYSTSTEHNVSKKSETSMGNNQSSVLINNSSQNTDGKIPEIAVISEDDKETKKILNDSNQTKNDISNFSDGFSDEFDDDFISAETEGDFEQMLV